MDDLVATDADEALTWLWIMVAVERLQAQQPGEALQWPSTAGFLPKCYPERYPQRECSIPSDQ